MSYKVEYHIISGRVVETRQCRLAGRPGEKSRARRAPRRAGSSSEKKKYIGRNYLRMRVSRRTNGKVHITIQRSFCHFFIEAQA